MSYEKNLLLIRYAIQNDENSLIFAIPPITRILNLFFHCHLLTWQAIKIMEIHESVLQRMNIIFFLIGIKKK